MENTLDSVFHVIDPHVGISSRLLSTVIMLPVLQPI